MRGLLDRDHYGVFRGLAVNFWLLEELGPTFDAGRSSMRSRSCPSFCQATNSRADIRPHEPRVFPCASTPFPSEDIF